MKKISNRQLTLLRKLNQKKYREQEQLFFIEGSRAVEQVLENQVLDLQLLCFDESQNYWEGNPWDKYISIYESVLLSSSEFEEVCDTNNPQGVLAVCSMPNEVEVNELAEREGIILATDAVQDPGNLGTIIRTASWFGVKGIISGKGTVDLFHPKVVRSTAGSTGSISYKNGSLDEDLSLLGKKGWQVVLLDGGDGAVDLKTVKAHSKTVLVVGNEANGIDDSLIKPNRVRAKIISPTEQEKVESLNAAIATSIALHAMSG